MIIIDEVDINDKKVRKRAYNKAYRAANVDKIKAYRADNQDKIKAYRADNQDKIKANNKAYRAANVDKIKAYQKANQDKIKDRMKAYNKAYRAANADEIKAYRAANVDQMKAYRADNKDKIKDQMKAYKNNRLKTNIQYKLSNLLRSRLRLALKHNQKTGSAIKDLGCSIVELQMYLESKFQSGMTWDNHGFYGWHIDHIKPLASFDLTDRAQLLLACHYTNLQPLWAIDNLSKGALFDIKK